MSFPVRLLRVGALLVAVAASAACSSSAGETRSGTSTSSPTTVAPSTPTTEATPMTPPPGPPPAFPTFTPDEFAELLDALAPQAGTLLLPAPPPIAGAPEVDAHIRALAEGRGYRVRSVAEVAMVSVEGIPVHPDAAADLQAMLDEARGLGHRMVPLSGHRSVERQQQIFVAALEAEGTSRIGRPFTAEEILAGDADAAIDAILVTRSIPGYSRHHSGLAVDLGTGDGGPFILFEGTSAEEWLRADDFANAKRHGYVPSYPRGSSPQGPEPEPWEYVWVGADAIRCASTHIAMDDPDAVHSCPDGEG